MKNAVRTLDTYIRARYPLIALLSHEEGRVLDNIDYICNKRNRRFAMWSATEGLQNVPGVEPESTQRIIAALQEIKAFQDETSTVFVMRDMHPYINDALVVRHLRDIALLFEQSVHSLIMLSPHMQLPPDLEKLVVLLDWPLPDFEELQAIVDRAVQDLDDPGIVRLNGDAEDLIKAMSGLTAFEARNVLASAIISTGELAASAIPMIVKEKGQIIRKSGVLEYYATNTTMNEVGGLTHLKRYAAEKLEAFSNEAAEFGVDAPKGVILVGIPGTGKSLAVKAIAGNKLPLLRMDVGALMGGLVGESEANMRQALRVAEAVAPCVLWVDEVEKGLGGATGGENDGGTTKRVFGTLLTWMQEKAAPVYVAATANDARSLAPEFIRRFDDLFWVDLPNLQDRAQVATVHLAKRKQDPAAFDLAEIAQATWGFTGAEIEKVVAAAIGRAWYEQRPVETADLLNAAGEIVPVCKTQADKLNELRAWAKVGARMAAEPIDAEPKDTSKAKKRFSSLD